METYAEFFGRTSSFEVAHLDLGNQYYITKEALKSKVNPDGTFRSFYGDTVVFPLPENIVSATNGVINMLYNVVPECFAERLPEDSLHMTLHDLTSSGLYEEIKHTLDENRRKIESMQYPFSFANRFIRVRANNIIPMVSTSLVLAIQPYSEEDYYRLMEFYTLFDKVVDLPYNFTPHITLAYFNSNGFEGCYAERLSKLVSRINEAECNFSFYLDTYDLVYQTFTNMGKYTNVKFVCR